MKRSAACLVVLAAALWAGAQTPAERTVFGSPTESDWRPPSNLPPGAEYHLVREDPVTHGVQALVRFPKGFSVPAHTHSCAETLIVLKGRLAVTAGSTARTLSAGDYVTFPAGAPHSLATKGWGRVVFVTTTDAPYDLKPVAP